MTHKHFDTGQENDSVKIQQIRDLSGALSDLGKMFKNTSFGGWSGATCCKAKFFGEGLFLWMTDGYTSLNKQMGKGSEKENWKFICHAVCAIINALYEFCQGAAHYVNQPRKQVWFVIKTVQLQEKIFEANYYNHEIVQRVLYQHLKTNVVLRSVYDAAMEKTNEKIAALEKHIINFAQKVK